MVEPLNMHKQANQTNPAHSEQRQQSDLPGWYELRNNKMLKSTIVNNYNNGRKQQTNII